MSENRENNENRGEHELSASQPAPSSGTEIFSDATSRLLNDSPQKVLSNSQPTESNGILKRSRKSLGNGRRVSFAATAHVRLFGSEEEQQKQKRKEQEEEAEEQRQLEAFRNQFVVDDESSGSSRAVNDVVNDLKDFEIKSSPLISKNHASNEGAVSTPSKRPFNSLSESNQSFDVDLKADEQPSFSSYFSPEKDMMDLTGCVGNILDELSSPPMSATSRRQSQMEFTSCVGSILAQISNEKAAAAAAATSIEQDSSEDMEMTQSVGALIMQQDSSSGPVVDVSFIGDCDQPASFNFMNSMSPSKNTTEKTTSSSSSSSSSLSSEVVTAEEIVVSTQMEISEVVDRESLQIAKEAVKSKKEEMFDLFGITVTTNNNNNVSCTTSEDAPSASLKEFLNDTGVRFLDNLSNMGRRETVGKPRDSTIITPVRRMYVKSVLVPETLAIERACGECVRTIEAQRQFLTEEEGKFNHHPPLAYREFTKSNSNNSVDNPDRSLILQKLKTLKSVARLFARESWYEWRRGFESNFYDELEKVLHVLKADYANLEVERGQLQITARDEIEPKFVELSRELGLLRARYESLSRSDWEEASALHEKVQEDRKTVETLDSELKIASTREAALRQSIDAVLETRCQLQDRLVNLKRACAQFEDCTELALTELKSTFALQEALNGWRIVQLREESLAWEYTRGTPMAPIQIRMNWNPSLTISSILIESEQASLATLRPANQLIQPEFTAITRSMTSLLNQLDLLVQLNRELGLIKVQCDVQLLSVVAGAQLPLLLTFFNFEAKIKFDVIIGASLALQPLPRLSFKLLSFANQYGPVTIDKINEIIDDSLLQCGSLKRIVNAISSNLLK